MQLSTQSWRTDFVVTRRQLADGEVRYFARNRKTLQRLYRIDSTLCGFYAHQLPKSAVIVDPDDAILKGA